VFNLEHYFEFTALHEASAMCILTINTEHSNNTPNGNKISGHRKCLPKEGNQIAGLNTTAHTGNANALLQQFVGKRIAGPHLWPPRSPDLTTPDSFVWELLK
jgi:hypothetical protein